MRGRLIRKKQVPKKTLVESSGGGTRTSAENAGETALLVESDAKSDAFNLSSWTELRDTISVCPDLPESTRQSLVELGDDAAHG